MSVGTLEQDWTAQASASAAADRWISRLVVGVTSGAILGLAGWSTAKLSAELSQPLFPVEGRLLVAGYPQSEAEVLVHRRDSRGGFETLSVGTTDRDGRFQLRLYDVGVGLPAGEYVATVRWRPLVVHGESFVAGPNLIAGLYSRPETSPLRITAPAAQALPTWNVPLNDDEQP